VRVVWALVLFMLAFAACSGRGLRPGTPPPEYEPPIVAPWPAEDAAASTDAAVPIAQSSADAPLPAVEPELSLDAGAR